MAASMEAAFHEEEKSLPHMLAYSLAGSTATAVLFGMAFMLATMYFRRYRTDRWWWKAIVALEMFFALMQLVMIVSVAGYEVMRLGRADKLGRVVIWNSIAHLSIGMAGAVNLGLTQFFLFYRCWRLSGRKAWVGVVGGLSVLNICVWIVLFGTLFSAFTPLLSEPAENHADLGAWQVLGTFEVFATSRYRIISRGFLLSATLTEWIMSALLIYNLSRHQPSLRSSRRIITQTIALAIQSSIPSTVVFTVQMALVFRNDYHNYLIQPLMYFGGVINLLIVLTTLHLRSRLRRIAQGGQDARNDAMIAEALQRAAEISAHPEPGQVVPTLRMQKVSGPIGDYQNALDDEEKDMDDELKSVSFDDMFSETQFPPARSPILGPGTTGNRSWHDPSCPIPYRHADHRHRDPLTSD